MAKFTQAKSGLFFPSEENLSIEVEGGYDKIMNHLILCDPEAFATPDTLVKHMKELEAQVEIYVRNSLQYCEMIKDKPELFRETRRRRVKVRSETKQYLDHVNIILRQLISSHEIHGGSLSDPNNAPSTDEVTHVTKQSVKQADIVLNSHETNGMSVIDNDDGINNDFVESPTVLSNITPLCVPVLDNLEPIAREATVLDLSSIEYSTQVALTLKSSALILKGIISHSTRNTHNAIDPPSLSLVPEKIDPCPQVTQNTMKTTSTNFHNSFNVQSGLCTTPSVPLPLMWAIHEDKYESGGEASPAPVPVEKYSPYEDPVEFVPKSSRPRVSFHFPPFPKHSVADKRMRKMSKWFLPHKSIKWKMENTYSSRYLFLIIIMGRFIIIQ